MILRIFRGVMLLTLISMAAWADGITLTLDGNFSSPDYSWYGYTDTAGQVQSQPVGPYITYISGDGYNNTPVYTFCYDINNDTDVGVAYSGQFETLTDNATMESTWLLNQLNLMGGFNAPLDDRGAIAMAIWQIMYPSSNNNGAAFPTDPAAQPFELDAAAAVANGSWTAADSALYPTWIPDDSSIQRFGMILPGAPENSQGPSAPEPASWGLFAIGILGLAAFHYRARFRRLKVAFAAGKSR